MNEIIAKEKKQELENKFASLFDMFGISYQRWYKFYPDRKRKWEFDFVIDMQKKIAVEVEGGIFNKGRHIQPGMITKTGKATGFIGDCEKYNEAAILGWTVLRYTSVDIKARPFYIVEQIKKAIGK